MSFCRADAPSRRHCLLSMLPLPAGRDLGNGGISAVAEALRPVEAPDGSWASNPYLTSLNVSGIYLASQPNKRDFHATTFDTVLTAPSAYFCMSRVLLCQPTRGFGDVAEA